MIDNSYHASPEVEELRSEKYQHLDQFRHESYPDDVQALLYSEKNGIEAVWVRLMFVNEKEYVGKLLNEPFQDYGVHEGTIICIIMANSNGKQFLVFNGRTAEILK